MKLSEKYAARPSTELPMLFQRILQNTIRDHFRRQKVRSLWTPPVSSLAGSENGDDRDLEGCLSIPGYVAYVTRRERVWVAAQDRHGKKIKVAGTGLLSRALQHELDHLDGKLYIDYLDSMDELMAVGTGDEEDDAEIREATSALA